VTESAYQQVIGMLYIENMSLRLRVKELEDGAKSNSTPPKPKEVPHHAAK